MRFFYSFIVGASFLFSVNQVYAFDFTDCDVVQIVVNGDQNSHVQLSCDVANLPACATSHSFVTYDKSTPSGKQYLALFMYAQAVSAKVSGYVDRNTCPVWQTNVVLLTDLRVHR